MIISFFLVILTTLKIKMTKIKIVLFILFALQSYSQNEITIESKLLENGKKIAVFEEITIKNTSNTALTEIVLNDWNHAFSSKSSALAKKFSDEFNRSYHLSSNKERGGTNIIEITDANKKSLLYFRKPNQIDIVIIPLEKPLLTGEYTTIKINYEITLPNSKFTKFGYTESKLYLRNCFLTLSSFHSEHQSEENSDDLTTEITSYNIKFQHDNFFINSDLEVEKTSDTTSK